MGAIECWAYELACGLESRQGLACVAGAGVGLVTLVLMLGLVAHGVIVWASGSGSEHVRLVWLLLGFTLGMCLVIVCSDGVIQFCGLECIGIAVLLVGYKSARSHAGLLGLKASV